jgi:two-component system OmpR family response regulator
MNLLLVEDDVELAHSVGDHFREHGIAVHHCADGESGLSSACAGDYQVIILDRMLPRLDGLSFVRKLRECRVTTPRNLSYHHGRHRRSRARTRSGRR